MCDQMVAGDEELALHLQFAHSSPQKPKEENKPPAIALPIADLKKETNMSSTGYGQLRKVFANRKIRWSKEARFFFANHYGEKWGSCGYRNFQILLGCVCEEVPDIRGVQKLICHSWKMGFDQKSLRQLGGEQLLNSRKWIGACEVRRDTRKTKREEKSKTTIS
jgi:hypothetical protein